MYQLELQAYSQEAVSEMRDVMEKGGVDSLATRGPPKAPAVSFVHNTNSSTLHCIGGESLF